MPRTVLLTVCLLAPGLRWKWSSITPITCLQCPTLVLLRFMALKHTLCRKLLPLTQPRRLFSVQWGRKYITALKRLLILWGETRTLLGRITRVQGLPIVTNTTGLPSLINLDWNGVLLAPFGAYRP